MKNSTLTVLAILMWFMVQPTNVGKGQAPAQPIEPTPGIPELIERGERLSEIDSLQNIEFAKLAKRKPPRLKDCPPAPASKRMLPSTERIYFRIAGEIVLERMYSRDGGFLIIDLDTVLPAIGIGRDTIHKIEYRVVPAPKKERGFFPWVKNIFKSKKKHK